VTLRDPGQSPNDGFGEAISLSPGVAFIGANGTQQTVGFGSAYIYQA
jgi:hypothetical protein